MLLDKNFDGHILVFRAGEVVGAVQTVDTDKREMTRLDPKDISKFIAQIELADPADGIGLITESYDALLVCPYCPDGFRLAEGLKTSGAVPHACPMHTCSVSAVPPAVIVPFSDNSVVINLDAHLKPVLGLDAWVKQLNMWLTLPWTDMEMTMGKSWSSTGSRDDANRWRRRYGLKRVQVGANVKELNFIIQHFARKGWRVARDPHNDDVLRFGGPKSLIGKVRKPKKARGDFDPAKMQDGDGKPEAAFEDALRETG